MTVVTLSSKFQVSVPKEVRDALRLKPGQKMVIVNTGNSINLFVQPSIADLVGIASGASAAGLRERDDQPVVGLAGKAKARGSSARSRARPA